MFFTSYSYHQVRFNDRINLSLTVSYPQKHRFFLIIIAHDSKQYCFLNSSYLTVLRIQVMVYVYRIWLYARVERNLVSTREICKHSTNTLMSVW